MILSFDTSCDDTAVSAFEDDTKYSNIVISQNSVHSKFGGIVPEFAARNHVNTIHQATTEALRELSVEIKHIDHIAVTIGPGLMPSLLVGVAFAKAIAYSNRKPIIPVNHIEGHIFSPFIGREIEFPFISLVVSGGHTHIFKVNGVGNYELMGKTLDDAAGEAFDKVARILGVGYPGGPIIDKLSKEGNPERFSIPQGMAQENTLDFSFSGPKTFVNNLVKKLGNLSKTDTADIAASFQKSVVDILCRRLFEASKVSGIKTLSISGGVSANSLLRNKLKEIASTHKLKVIIPELPMTTDNAVMIAKVASLSLSRGTYNYSKIDADPRFKTYEAQPP